MERPFGENRILRDSAAGRRVFEAELVKWRKGDLAKVRLAQRLRDVTLVTPAWIAGRLQMGSVAYPNNRLYLLRKGTLN